jgi:ADP-ribose pyrophosphatase
MTHRNAPPPPFVRSRLLTSHPAIKVFEHDVAVDVAAGEAPRTRPIVTLSLSDWAMVLARTDAGAFLLVAQHRFGIGAEAIEVAGGLVDPGEVPIDAARRELLEETGHDAPALVSLGWVFPNPALHDNRAHLFFADGVTRIAEVVHTAEEITHPRYYEREALERAVQGGDIRHGLSLLVIARALAHLDAARASEGAR